jgi:hypothetical protein
MPSTLFCEDIWSTPGAQTSGDVGVGWVIQLPVAAFKKWPYEVATAAGWKVCIYAWLKPAARILFSDRVFSMEKLYVAALH